jgi:hypothetical protein
MHKVGSVKVLLTAGLMVLSSISGIASSHAADIPTVRLISPVLNGKTSIDRTTTDLQIGAQKWYREGSKSIVTTAEQGQELTFEFLVTKDGTTPWADKELILLVGAPYSGSTGSWTIGGTAIGPQKGEWSEEPAGITKATTDSKGIAKFVLKNTDTKAKFFATDVLSGFFSFKGNADRIYTQLKPAIAGLRDYDEPYLLMDIVSVDVVLKSDAPAPTPSATATPKPVAPAALPSMRLISPEFGPSNSVDTTGGIAQFYSPKTRAYYTYIAAGTTLTLKYLVTKDGTTPLPNANVTLQVNAPYSISNANWLSGSNKIGKPASDSASGADLKGVTDAKGEVTFIIKNTDTTGTEAKPATPNSPAPAKRLYGTFKAIIEGYGDKDADVDLVTFDVYAAPKAPAKATTISCFKGKTKKTVTAVNPKCPAGFKKK